MLRTLRPLSLLSLLPHRCARDVQARSELSQARSEQHKLRQTVEVQRLELGRLREERKAAGAAEVASAAVAVAAKVDKQRSEEVGTLQAQAAGLRRQLAGLQEEGESGAGTAAEAARLRAEAEAARAQVAALQEQLARAQEQQGVASQNGAGMVPAAALEAARTHVAALQAEGKRLQRERQCVAEAAASVAAQASGDRSEKTARLEVEAAALHEQLAHMQEEQQHRDQVGARETPCRCGVSINQSITFKVHEEPAEVSWAWAGGEGCASGVHSIPFRCGVPACLPGGAPPAAGHRTTPPSLPPSLHARPPCCVLASSSPPCCHHVACPLPNETPACSQARPPLLTSPPSRAPSVACF